LNAGLLTIDDGEIHSPALKAEDVPDVVVTLRHKLFEAVGDTQLPEVMLKVDSHVRYSWILLGREPRSAEELLLVYGALLAQATALTPTDTARMMRGFSSQAISQAISMMQHESRLREANAAVFDHLHSHRIAEHWGRADLASSDMMSLETARNIWNSRADPRRKTQSHGTYSHLSARWGTSCHQGFSFGRRKRKKRVEFKLSQIAGYHTNPQKWRLPIAHQDLLPESKDGRKKSNSEPAPIFLDTNLG
jgi:hypothetical protein